MRILQGRELLQNWYIKRKKNYTRKILRMKLHTVVVHAYCLHEILWESDVFMSGNAITKFTIFPPQKVFFFLS